MPIWKFPPGPDTPWADVDSKSWSETSADSYSSESEYTETEVLEDFRLKFDVSYQWMEDFKAPQWATDGTWFNDMTTQLAAYYEAYDEDLKMGLGAYYEAFDENWTTKLWAAATYFVNLKTKLFVATLAFSNLPVKLITQAYAFTNLQWKALAAGYGFSDLACSFEAVSPTRIINLPLKLEVTDGLVLRNFKLNLAVISAVPQYKAVVAQRLSSVKS